MSWVVIQKKEWGGRVAEYPLSFNISRTAHKVLHLVGTG